MIVFKNGWFRKSDILTNKLFEKYDFNKINTLHIYLSIDENNEVDTWDIMNNIFENYKTKIIVPKVNGDKLDHYYLNKNTILTKYNILEPLNAKPYTNDSFDMIFISGVMVYIADEDIARLQSNINK